MADVISNDERRKIAQLQEEGVHGGIDRIPGPEETEEASQQGNAPYPQGEWKTSYEPGERAPVEVSDEIDELFRKPETADTKLLSEASDYLREKYGVEYNAEYGLSVRDVDEETLKDGFREWRVKKEVENEEEEGENRNLSENEKERIEQLKTLQKRPETATDPNAFNLMLNGAALDRLTKDVDGPGQEEAKTNREAVNGFFENWTSFPNDIESVGFEVKGGRITNVVMQLKPGQNGGNQEAIAVPVHIFRKVFGVGPHKDPRMRKETGLDLGGFVDPLTPEYKLHEIMSNVRINGERLNPEVRFFIGSDEMPIPIAESDLFRSRVEI